MELRKIYHVERPGGPAYAIVMTRYSRIKYILRHGPVIIDRPHVPVLVYQLGELQVQHV